MKNTNLIEEKYETSCMIFSSDHVTGYVGTLIYSSHMLYLKGARSQKEICIDFKSIIAIGERKYPLIPLKHLYIKTSDNQIYYILVSNRNTFIKYVLSHARNAVQLNKKSTWPVRLLFYFIFLLIFPALPISLIIIQYSSIMNSSYILYSNLIIYSSLYLYFTAMILDKKNKVLHMPRKALLLLLWLVPFIGFMGVLAYFDRFSKGPRHRGQGIGVKSKHESTLRD